MQTQTKQQHKQEAQGPEVKLPANPSPPPQPPPSPPLGPANGPRQDLSDLTPHAAVLVSHATVHPSHPPHIVRFYGHCVTCMWTWVHRMLVVMCRRLLGWAWASPTLAGLHCGSVFVTYLMLVVVCRRLYIAPCIWAVCTEGGDWEWDTEVWKYTKKISTLLNDMELIWSP